LRESEFMGRVIVAINDGVGGAKPPVIPAVDSGVKRRNFGTDD
jgi:hypothetical protein